MFLKPTYPFARKLHRRAALAGILTALLMLCGCKHVPSTTVYPDPDAYAIRGIDISAHNGDIDFEAVKRDGISFVLIKATEGTSFKDRKFQANYLAAKTAGLMVGAYHFFRFDAPGYMQALNIANSLNGRTIDLPVAIDIEEWTNPNSQATDLIQDRLDEMIDYLESHGYRVMLYSNKNGSARFIRGRYEGYPLWLCSLGAEPAEFDWTLWQATHHGAVKGVKGAVDVNAFNGTPEAWANFLGLAQ